ncbi:hypothetical protein DOTSEDRAFT_142514 [Dothistroma septosporum NZE10]|uniref:Uncharacterized protein n=1 Tax=Dothistroma septosporum (strain NZE10 / CBS 128990) TaxID=675120 RepID=N1Q3C8_DOTSN|nr:hypothetical protein DOTSEDRAFT_142514 [Dothistroma septosporum NZE10]
MAAEPLAVVPGHSLGFVYLGAALQQVLSSLKGDKDRFPAIHLSYTQSRPLSAPVVVTLPENGLRLRFDGSDQRLRLIEVLDFARTRLTYKASELVKKQEDGASATFKRIYQLFGASYPGEYLPPKSGRDGTYVLSWPGVAFNFPLQHAAWSPDKDHVSLLGSHAAAPATHMAIFDGHSWPEARNTLFVQIPSAPRTPALTAQPRDALPPEIELAIIETDGKISLERRAPALPFHIVLNQTTPQDLITELGAPEATHRRDVPVATEEPVNAHPRNNSRSLAHGRPHATPPSSYSSTGTDTFDTDFDSGDADDDSERLGRETFWCYFSHGMDILVGPPSDQVSVVEINNADPTPLFTSPHLVVVKVVLHGNVPGSYAFNRHRRSRWVVDLPGARSIVSSETPFEETKAALMQAFQGIIPESEMGRGKVVNRTWGPNPTDSTFFLPDADQDLVEGGGSESGLDNTKLYDLGFLQFEVASNDAVVAMTVT